MSEAGRVIEEMARATSARDLDAVRRILARKPDLSQCLHGYDLCGEDEGFTILKMLLDAGADIKDCSFGETLLHTLVDGIADSQGSRYGKEPDWSEVGQMIELGADPLLRDGEGRNLLDIAALWGDRASLDAYLRSLGIRIE
jgi:ankyrin repeat protein